LTTTDMSARQRRRSVLFVRSRHPTDRSALLAATHHLSWTQGGCGLGCATHGARGTGQRWHPTRQSQTQAGQLTRDLCAMTIALVICAHSSSSS
jgi:hypothetical protein